MNELMNSHLPFWHFIENLEKEFGYKKSIDRYTLFLKACCSLEPKFAEPIGAYAFDGLEFRQLCKFLFLQNPNHETRFNEIIEIELKYELSKGEIKQEQVGVGDDEENVFNDPEGMPFGEGDTGNRNPTEQEKESQEQATNPIETGNTTTEDLIDTKEEIPTTAIPTEPVFFQYQFDTDLHNQQKINLNKEVNFLDHNNYFPLTRRDMIKNWHHLQILNSHWFESQLNISGSVQNIAKEGMLTQLIYELKYKNDERTLIFFADTRGSMTPFEGITDWLIETAKGKGGHTDARSYYFNNIPSVYVFEKKNLSNPVKLVDALKFSNPKTTFGIIISDAGSARGSTNQSSVTQRVDLSFRFIKTLQQYTTKIIWLNPMPAHRWKNTAAEKISLSKPTDPNLKVVPIVMLSILDENGLNFQNALHRLRWTI